MTTLDRSPYRLEFDEQFSSPELDESRWLPYYLPHWTSRATSRARYDIRDGMLRLRIDEDQPPWSPELDGQLRCSNLQTGTRSGPVGSPDGQHRFRAGQVVREEQPTERLYTPGGGLIEVRARGIADPRSMVAFWLIGFEDAPQESGEICVFEAFGEESDRGLVGVGVHPHNDARIRDDFVKVPVDDVLAFHTYSAEWLPDRIRFFVDDRQVYEVEQAIDYPMQLMLDVYEFEAPPSGSDAPSSSSSEGSSSQAPYPKVFEVDWVRGWAAVSAS